MTRFQGGLAALTLALVAGVGARADLVTLGPVQDNTLIESATGASSNGAGPAFFAGRIGQGSIRRGLVAFDLNGSIPPGSTVTAVTLTLTMEQTNSGARTAPLHRLLASWGEGESASAGGSGAPSAPGDATWIHTFFDTEFWTTPGGDFAATASATIDVDGPGAYTWGSTPALVSDVQGWLDDPSTNHGWILRGDETGVQTAKRYASRESPDAASHPALVVEFVPPCIADPRGPGYWHRQCLGLGAAAAGSGLHRRGQGPAGPTEPGFEGSVVPCVEHALEELGLAPGACAAIAPGAPWDCEGRMRRRLASLLFNLCAERLATSCPAGGPSCGTVGERVQALAEALAAGDCWNGASCDGGE